MSTKKRKRSSPSPVQVAGRLATTGPPVTNGEPAPRSKRVLMPISNKFHHLIMSTKKRKRCSPSPVQATGRLATAGPPVTNGEPAPRSKRVLIPISNKLSLGKKIEVEKIETELYDGKLNGVPVIVKRVAAKKAPSIVFMSARYKQLSNDHDCLVRVCDTGYDDNGKYFHIAMEKCTNTLQKELAGRKLYTTQNSGKVKKLLRNVFKAMRYLHEDNIVHGSIRPANVLEKCEQKFGKCKYKLGGMGERCKYVHKSLKACINDNDLGEYARDYYDYGRTVLACVSKGSHKFLDDDALDDHYFDTGEKFKTEMKALKKVDGVAYDLVFKLLRWKKFYKSFQGILDHPFFYPPGKYIGFLMRVSDHISDVHADKALKNAIDKESQAVFKRRSDWSLRIDADWYRIMNTTQNQNPAQKRKRRRNRTKKKYDTKKISGLLRISRNTLHYPNNLKDPNNLKLDIWKKIGVTSFGFECYLLRKFPLLFQKVYEVVKSRVPVDTYLEDGF